MSSKSWTFLIGKNYGFWNYSLANKARLQPNVTEHDGRTYRFKAALKLTRFYHGHSVHFWFKDLNSGAEMMMQGTEMEDILLNHSMEKGVICGIWGVVNRGGTISIKLIEELEELQENDTTEPWPILEVVET